MRSRAHLIATLWLAATLATGSHAQVPASSSEPPPIASSTAAVPAGDYVVGAQDLLQVTVFNQPEFSGKFEVGTDGALTFPLVGRITVAGLTTRGVEQVLHQKLTPAFLRNPQISVTIDAYRSQQFFVMGEVNAPGPFFLSGRMTLIQAIARAGSLKASASDEVLVIRAHTSAGPVRPEEADQKDVRAIDFSRLASGHLEENVVVEAGDTIYVPRAETVFVMGEVKNPGPYRYSRAVTVQQYLSMAGGPTDRGATNRITVKRVVNGKPQSVKVTLDEKIAANDTILVPEKFF